MPRSHALRRAPSLARALRREDGSSLVAVVLILFVVVIVGTTSLQMALHSNDSTHMDRQRVQSIQAAEAAVSRAMNRLEVNPACDVDVTSPEELSDGSDVISKYQYRVDPETSTTCGDTLNRVIHAWGYAPVKSERSTRHLEVQVQLIPQEGFQFTLFASGPNGIVAVKNTGTVDGDIYAEHLDQTKNNINADKVLSPGSIDTQNNAVYSGTLWAGGDVFLRQNGQVGGSIIAAGSSGNGDVVLENNVSVARDVKAKGTVSLPTNHTVGGSISQNNPNLPPPPVLVAPTFTWDPGNYTPAPAIYSSATLLAAALETNKNDLRGTYYLNSPSSTLTMPRDARITGPLTIVTTGKVAMGRTMTDSGGTWQVAIMALNGGTSAIGIEQPATFSNGLDVLLYTPGEIVIKNQLSMKGALYADKIEIKNSVTISRSEDLASNPPPGFDFTQASAARFMVVPTLWREVVPGSPS